MSVVWLGSAIFCNLYSCTRDTHRLINSAHADPGDRPQQIRSAQNLQIQGRRLLKREDFRGALRCFERSHQHVPDIKNLVIIGAIHIKLNQCKEAFKAWRSALQICSGCDNAQEINEKISKYTTQCASVLEVVSRPPARLRIDGVSMGATPYRDIHLIGRHRIEMSAVGYENIDEIRLVQPRKPLKIDVALEPAGEQLAEGIERDLTLQPRRASGEQREHPPAKPAQPSGPMLPIISPPVITPAFQTHLDNDVQEDPNRTLRRRLWITSAMLALGAGATFYHSNLEFDALEELRQRPSTSPNPKWAQRADRAEMFQTTSRVMLALATTSLITSLFLFE